MVKKIKPGSDNAHASTGGLKGKHLADSVKASAQQIWLAGMGAFSKAQAEGGKAFESLVKDGLSLQRKTQAVAEEKIGEVTGKMSAMADTVTSKAGQNWDKLESIFEARTAKAMNKLGVPTAKDVDALVQRVDQLAAAVARLSKGDAPAKPARARPAGAAQPAKAGKSSAAADAAAKAAHEPAVKPAIKAAVKTASRAAAKRAPRKKAVPAADTGP